MKIHDVIPDVIHDMIKGVIHYVIHNVINDELHDTIHDRHNTKNCTHMTRQTSSTRDVLNDFPPKTKIYPFLLFCKQALEVVH